MEQIILKNVCHHPILLDFRLHWRLGLNSCLLDTENELGDGVGQTHVLSANRGRCFQICNWFLRQNTLKYKVNLEFLRSMRIFLSGGELFDMNRNKMRAFPSTTSSSLCERQSKPRLNPSNSRREIQVKSCPSWVILRRARRTIFHFFPIMGNSKKAEGSV